MARPALMRRRHALSSPCRCSRVAGCHLAAPRDSATRSSTRLRRSAHAAHPPSTKRALRFPDRTDPSRARAGTRNTQRPRPRRRSASAGANAWPIAAVHLRSAFPPWAAGSRRAADVKAPARFRTRATVLPRCRHRVAGSARSFARSRGRTCAPANAESHRPREPAPDGARASIAVRQTRSTSRRPRARRAVACPSCPVRDLRSPRARCRSCPSLARPGGDGLGLR